MSAHAEPTPVPTTPRIARQTPGMAEPKTIMDQKVAYMNMLDAQLKQGSTVVDNQTKAQKEYLDAQAGQQKNQFNMQIDMEVQQQKMALDQQRMEQLMALQKQTNDQKAQLEKQSIELTMNFEAKRAEEALSKKQAEDESAQMHIKNSMQEQLAKFAKGSEAQLFGAPRC